MAGGSLPLHPPSTTPDTAEATTSAQALTAFRYFISARPSFCALEHHRQPQEHRWGLCVEKDVSVGAPAAGRIGGGGREMHVVARVPRSPTGYADTVGCGRPVPSVP